MSRSAFEIYKKKKKSIGWNYHFISKTNLPLPFQHLSKISPDFLFPRPNTFPVFFTNTIAVRLELTTFCVSYAPPGLFSCGDSFNTRKTLKMKRFLRTLMQRKGCLFKSYFRHTLGVSSTRTAYKKTDFEGRM